MFGRRGGKPPHKRAVRAHIYTHKIWVAFARKRSRRYACGVNRTRMERLRVRAEVLSSLRMMSCDVIFFLLQSWCEKSRGKGEDNKCVCVLFNARFRVINVLIKLLRALVPIRVRILLFARVRVRANVGTRLSSVLALRWLRESAWLLRLILNSPFILILSLTTGLSSNHREILLQTNSRFRHEQENRGWNRYHPVQEIEKQNRRFYHPLDEENPKRPSQRHLFETSRRGKRA